MAATLLTAGCSYSAIEERDNRIIKKLATLYNTKPTIRTHEVAYNGNGNSAGSVPVDTNSYGEGQTVTILGNTGNLMKDGYTFIGWAFNGDGSGTTYQEGQTFSMGTSNTTLYALWTSRPTYSITYMSNGSTSGAVPAGTTNYLQGTTVAILGNSRSLKKNNFTFAGWNTLTDGTGTNYSPGQTLIMGTSNIVLYAKWITFSFVFDFGTYSGSYKNVYTIWAENSDEGFYYPIYICNRLQGIGGALTGTALPYWKINKYPHMKDAEIDAVTGATQQNTNFTVSFNLPVDAPRQFTVYFETDVSYNPNDWFTDQPAILYSSVVDMDNLQDNYSLSFKGWTANEKTAGVIPGADIGMLQAELRYITNLKDGSGFGAADSRSETDLVDSANVAVSH